MKSQLYFPFARWLGFWARLVILRWKPRIIVVMGSAGKTTTMMLLKQVLENNHSVYFSKKANSAIGIPLNILGMTAHHYTTRELLKFALRAPLRCLKLLIFRRKHAIYLVEADSDRPGEIPFVTSLLQPECVVWVSSFATHTENFSSKKDLEFEFAHMIQHNPDLKHAFVVESLRYCDSLKDANTKIHFVAKKHVDISYLYPPEFEYTIGFAYAIAKQYDVPEESLSTILSSFEFPPGRCSILRGIRKTTILDSTYNSSPEALLGILQLFSTLPNKRKIAVLGDMRELGSLSKEEHERIAKKLVTYSFDHIILVGPAMKEYVLPYLISANHSEHAVHSFDNTYRAGVYLKEVLLKRGDAILLKASQNTLFFEIIAEMLLENEQDVEKLCRRELFWEKKREEIKKEFYDGIK